MSTDHMHGSDHHHSHEHEISQPHRFWQRTFGFLLTAAVLFAAGTMFVFVDETECVLVERLGHIVAVYDQAEDRGLHVKLPWPISTTRRFDRRTQLFDPPGREIFTSDKKNITIDTYVCWRIASPGANESANLTDRPVVCFFRSLGSIDVAEARLDSRVRSILSTEIGHVELSHLMSVANTESGPDENAGSLLDRISASVREQVKQRPDEREPIRQRLGIEVVDVRIQRINFPLGNQQAVFERMKSERRKIADRYRSAGMAENTMIKSQADRQYNEILAKADADAERIRGEAEAEAITILNTAHAQDPEFYRVLRTLDTYRKILNERTTLVLSASSNLLKLLTEGIPQTETQAPRSTAPKSNRSSEQPLGGEPPSGTASPLPAPPPGAAAGSVPKASKNERADR